MDPAQAPARVPLGHGHGSVGVKPILTVNPGAPGDVTYPEPPGTDKHSQEDEEGRHTQTEQGLVAHRYPHCGLSPRYGEFVWVPLCQSFLALQMAGKSMTG